VFSELVIGDGLLGYDFKDRAEEGFKATWNVRASDRCLER
jgi:hypothetical protein